MTAKTLYVAPKDRMIVDRAGELLLFYEKKSLSMFLTEQCKLIVKKYEPQH